MEEFVTEDELKRWQFELDDLEHRLANLLYILDRTDCPDKKEELNCMISGGVVVFNQICAEMIENHCGDTKH